MSDTSSRPISIFPVLMVNFIGMLGYSIILPFLIFLVRKFGGNEFIYGLLGSIYPAFQLFGAPLLGRWSDQIGRKRVLIISQIGTFLAWILFIVALMIPKTELGRVETSITGGFIISIPLLVLFVARALDGITGGNVSVANAYLSDISTEENRKANFGKMASSNSLGFILGPAFAGLLGATIYEEMIPVMAAALISLIAIWTIYRFLPESRPELVSSDLPSLSIRKLFQVEQRECYQMENCPDTGLKAVLQIPQIPLLFGIYFFTFLGFSFFYVGLPVFAAEKMGWTSFQLGLFLTISSAIMVLVQGPGLSYLSKRVSDAYLVIVGSFLLGISFFFLPTEKLWGIYTANVLLSIGNGLMWPSFLSILSRVGKKDVQGTIQGYANSMGSLASIFGLILGGLLFNWVGSAVFYSAGIMLMLIFFISFRLIKLEQTFSGT